MGVAIAGDLTFRGSGILQRSDREEWRSQGKIPVERRRSTATGGKAPGCAQREVCNWVRRSSPKGTLAKDPSAQANDLGEEASIVRASKADDRGLFSQVVRLSRRVFGKS